jgi:hypothetical protein
MDRDLGIGLHVDPLGDLEVQRALALARARESYPAVPRETLLGYCEAAWDVALQADPRGRDLQGSFDRALLIIAWTQRRSGGRVPLRELIDQTVPRIALEPFIAQPRTHEVGVQPEQPVPSRRSPLRLPFSSPIPVGAAVAAGVVGVGVLSQAEVVPIAPLQPAGSDEAASGEAVASRDGADRGSKQAADGAPRASGEAAAALGPETADAQPGQAFAAPAAPASGASGARADATPKPASNGDSKAAGRVEDAEAVQVAAETAGAEAAPPAPVTPPAPPSPQPLVRVEVAPQPTAIILEVSTPQRPATREQDDAPPEMEPPESPAEPISDERDEPQSERRSGRDYDDEGALDVLEDEPAPVTPPAPEEPAAEEVPPAPAPVAPAPAPVEAAPAPLPAAPAPAPEAPAAPAPTTPPPPPA